jgi:sulfonate transport system substrate-binding protein
LLELDGARHVADGKGLTSGLSYQVASPKAIAAKRGALEDFLRRPARARHWALAHLDEYASARASVINLPAAAAKRWFERARILPVPIDPALVAEQQRGVELYAKAAVIKSHFDIGDAFDRSFNTAVLGLETPR